MQLKQFRVADHLTCPEAIAAYWQELFSGNQGAWPDNAEFPCGWSERDSGV